MLKKKNCFDSNYFKITFCLFVLVFPVQNTCVVSEEHHNSFRVGCAKFIPYLAEIFSLRLFIPVHFGRQRAHNRYEPTRKTHQQTNKINNATIKNVCDFKRKKNPVWRKKNALDIDVHLKKKIRKNTELE